MRLNLGCGNKKKAGFVGVDKFPCEAVEHVADLEQRLPFEDDSVEEIWMDNVVEHIPDLPALFAEIHRICRDGARITVLTPHFTSLASWRDPTHVHHLSYFSMDHFEKQSVAHYTNPGAEMTDGGSSPGFEVLERHLSFGGLMGNIGRLICWMSPRKYEKDWCFLFRASSLRFVLGVRKG